MKRYFLCLFFLLLTVCAFADTPYTPPLLNSITLQLTADTWVTTNTAKVTVMIYANLNQQQLTNAQQAMQDSLQEIAKTDWHITNINRIETQAKLEQLTVTAEARLPVDMLGDLREKAKVISKEGENFQIQDIAYKPSNAEYEAAKTELRTEIYKQAKAELASINKLYPEERFTLHAVNFVPMEIIGAQRAMPMLVATAKNVQTVNVNDHLTMTAVVILAVKMV